MSDLRVQITHVLGAPDALLDPTAGRAHIDQLAPLVRQAILDNSTDELLETLQELESTKEADIRAISDSPDNPFREVVASLNDVQAHADTAAESVRICGEQMRRSGTDLVARSQSHENLERTRSNLISSLDTIKVCLQALEHTNQVHTLLKTNHKVAAVHSLGELRTMGLERLRYLGLANLLSQAVPALTKLILNATMDGLEHFNNNLDVQIPVAGSKVRELMRLQRKEWSEITSQNPHLSTFLFNSPVEIAYRESGNNYLTDAALELELDPLYEANLIYSKLSRISELTSKFASLRNITASHLVPQNLKRLDQDVVDSVVGFCVLDRVISNQLPDLRSSKQVDDTWEQLAQQLAAIANAQFPSLKSTQDLEEVKVMLGGARDTLENFGFNVGSLDTLLRELLKQFSKSLVETNRTSFMELWNSADHMPMVIKASDLYSKVMGIVWSASDVDASFAKDAPYPRVLPFSQIYALACADLQVLIKHHTSFMDQFQNDPTVVEDTVVMATDTYLTDIVGRTLQNSLTTSNREQLVQTLIDLKYFVAASTEVRHLLESVRMSGRKGRVSLRAIDSFAEAHKLAESRVYDLVNSVVDEFIDMANYDWRTEVEANEHSSYVLDMAAYLMTLANSALARLPKDLRAFVYLGAADHLNTRLVDLLTSAPEGITSKALANFDQDLSFLETFVGQLAETASTASMRTTLTEARQTLELLKSEDPTEYNDPQARLRKYDRVRASIVPQLLGKIRVSTPGASPRTPQANFVRRYLSGD